MIARVVDRLAARYPSVPAQTVAEITGSMRQRFDGHPIRDYVPLLVERRATEAIAILVD